MKKITRPLKPSFYDIDSLINYQNIFYPSGEIKALWQNEDLKQHLRNMTTDECIFCGASLGEQWDVEHYLPKKPFCYLAYSYENLLPSCITCNRSLKRTFYPENLKQNTNYAEPHYLELPNTVYFNRHQVLQSIDKRLIDPTFDNPEDHLEFNPITCEYIAKTPMGKQTLEMFFFDRKYHNEKLQKLSTDVLESIQKGLSKETILTLLKFSGYSYYCEKLYDYWSDLLGL